MANDYLTRMGRFEFKRDPEHGDVVGQDGCHYDSEAEAMYYSLGLCGCGCPEEVHALMIDCLRQFAGDVWPKPGIDAIAKIVQEKPTVVAEFIAHFLAKCDLTEHGGSVYGCWLSERGKQFIECGPMKEEE